MGRGGASSMASCRPDISLSRTDSTRRLDSFVWKVELAEPGLILQEMRTRRWPRSRYAESGRDDEADGRSEGDDGEEMNKVSLVLAVSFGDGLPVDFLIRLVTPIGGKE